MNVVDLVRPELRGMKPYAAAEQVQDTVRLNANESPLVTGADRFRRPLNRYPEVRPRRLRELLSTRFGVDASSLLVTRGSSEAIDLLIRTFCRAAEDSILTTPPTFSMYAHYAQVQHAVVKAVPLDRDADFKVDPAAVIDAIDASTKLIFLCSPNNPTGTSIPCDVIETILEAALDRCAVVLDEAYIEFSDADSAAQRLGDFPHLIVLRTLSKALAFAGARCGAIIAAPELIDILDAVQAPYALATPVVECIEDALTGELSMLAEQQLEDIRQERERVREALVGSDRIDYIWPSDGNFLLVRCTDADSVKRSAESARVLVRAYGGELADTLRISIGSREENDRLLDAVLSTGDCA